MNVYVQCANILNVAFYWFIYIYMQCANILNHPFAVWVGSMTCFCRITVMPRKLLNVVCNGDCFGPKRPVFRGVNAEGCTLKNGTERTSWQPKRCQLYRSIMLSSSLGWINFVNPCPAPRAFRDGSTEDTTLHTASPAPAFQYRRTAYFVHLIQIMHVVLVPGMAFHAIFDASLRCLDVSWSRMCISILTREDTENHSDPYSTNSHPNHYPFFVVAFLRLWSLSFSSWAPHLPKRNKMRFAKPCFWGSPGPLGAFPSVPYMPLW